MRHFDTLDGLRGVAAICVVFYHLHTQGVTGEIAPHGYLAVDFFFELSGFVMAYAYRGPLLSSMRWRDFARKRLIRIYPLAVLGVALGLFVMGLQWLKQPSASPGPLSIAGSGVLNLLLLPDVFSGDQTYGALFPGNGAIWSLFFEVAINLAWAGVAAVATVRSLRVFVAVSGAALAVLVVAHGSVDLGSSWPTFWGGVARVCFGFGVGLLIEQTGFRLRLPASRAVPAAIAAALAGTLLMPLVPEPSVPWWDFVCLAVLFPALIAAGLGQTREGAISRVLGRISYPLYAIHFPLIIGARLVRRSLGSTTDEVLFAGVALVLMIGMSYGASTLYDEPARRRLSRLAEKLSGQGSARARPA
jgi:peptidoglycan/LPS O-acetylase OafA/YrhL